MSISVIICTRNRADSLRQTLNSVFDPTNLQSPDWEVVVVDNNSDDHTAQVCLDYQATFPGHFRFLVEKNVSKSKALNAAIAAARGEFLAFTDDDVTCAPNCLQRMQAVLLEYSADAIQGRILLDCEGGHPDWLDHYLGLTVGWRDCSGQVVELQGTLCGTNMIVRAEVFRKLGGFSPELGPGVIGLGEDTEFSLRMRQAGCRLLYAPQILIWHRLPRTRLTRPFIRKRFFQQGRAEAYLAPLPASPLRFALYVLKQTIFEEVAAIWHRSSGRSALALRGQCEARSHAGFFWQHWLFRRGVPRQLSEHFLARAKDEVGSSK